MSYEPTDWKNGDVIGATQLNNIERGISDMNSSYTPTEWTNGDVITAEKLNNIETGIVNSGGGGGASVEIFARFDYDTTTSTATCDKTYAQIGAAYEDGILYGAIYVNDELWLVSILASGVDYEDTHIYGLGFGNYIHIVPDYDTGDPRVEISSYPDTRHGAYIDINNNVYIIIQD